MGYGFGLLVKAGYLEANDSWLVKILPSVMNSILPDWSSFYIIVCFKFSSMGSQHSKCSLHSMWGTMGSLFLYLFQITWFHLMWVSSIHLQGSHW